MKWRTILLITLLMISVTSSNPSVVSAQIVPEISDIKILMFIADNFGWNYYDAREIFESWGVNVTTVAYSSYHNLTSCPKPGTGENETIIVEYTYQEMTPDMVSEFNCLFVSSGIQWQTLRTESAALTFIADAYNLGLIIASVCTGTRLVAESNGIVNGSKVVSYVLSSAHMREAGATPIEGMEAVADGCMITGASGGGQTGGGYLKAPTSEVCAEVVRHVLGLSRVTSTSLTSSKGLMGTDVIIGTVIDNLNDTLGDILSTNIQNVTALVYRFEDRSLYDTIELTDENHDGNYTGQFTSLDFGQYIVDIEVKDSNLTLEVVREVEIFEVGIKLIDILLSSIAIGSVLIIVLVIVMKKKK